MSALTRALGVAVLVAGCGGDAAPAFPADYAATYPEVRNCRPSLDHDLMNIRVLASPDAAEAYLGRAAPFPAGAIVLKEQYAEDDAACAGPVELYTVMEKLGSGSSPDTLDWRWERVSAARAVAETDGQRCVRCHDGCGVAPVGYDGTCAMP